MTLSNELDYHLREIRADCRALGLTATELRRSATDRQWDDAQRHLLDLTGIFEHLADTHFPRALALLPPTSLGHGESSASVFSETELDAFYESGLQAEPDPAACADGLQALSIAVEEGAELVQRLDLRTSESASNLPQILQKLAKLTNERLLPHGVTLYGRVEGLRRAADPEYAARLEREARLAEPKAIRQHPQAGTLQACPNCGAELDRNDRTFTGSYCENCQTRWETES